jgi:hypothetical protein
LDEARPKFRAGIAFNGARTGLRRLIGLLARLLRNRSTSWQCRNNNREEDFSHRVFYRA